jgi:uncharacterized protein (DUF433 family)
MSVKIAPSIIFDPSLHLDKPVVQGTQVPVEEIITRLAAGETVETLMETYQITQADIQAALGYAASKLAKEEIGTLLEESIRAGDTRQFVALTEKIDWSTRRPEELTQAIDLALSLDIIRLATNLAELGGRLFPDHKRIQQAAKVLASPAGTNKSRLSRPRGLKESRAWLREHAGQYQGQWVAVREGELLDAAPSLEALTPVIGQGEEALNTIVTRVL